MDYLLWCPIATSKVYEFNWRPKYVSVILTENHVHELRKIAIPGIFAKTSSSTSKCSRSHDFFDVENKDKTKQLGLDKFSNSTIKEILVWSLPQVCPLYLEAKCSSDKCFYLHACSKAVQGLDSVCSLSHNLVDNHNKNVLRKFGLAPREPLAIECVAEVCYLTKGQRLTAKPGNSHWRRLSLRRQTVQKANQRLPLLKIVIITIF